METDPLGTAGQQWPVTFRLGAVGLGVGVGCGIGVGFGNPLNLGALPGIGQAAQGISSGLSQLPGPLAGAGQVARQKLLALGVRGLDAGLGCGVGLGYGFGAGLMLNPSATDQLLSSAQRLAGKVVAAARLKLHELGISPPAPAPAPAAAESAAGTGPPRPSFPQFAPVEAPGSSTAPSWAPGSQLQGPGRALAPPFGGQLSLGSALSERGLTEKGGWGAPAPPGAAGPQVLGLSRGKGEEEGGGLAEEFLAAQGGGGGGVQTLLATQAVLALLLRQQARQQELEARVQALEAELGALAAAKGEGEGEGEAGAGGQARKKGTGKKGGR